MFIKRIWQWLKKTAVKILSFLGVYKPKSTAVSEQNANHTVDHEGESTALSKKIGVESIVDGIDPENIQEFKDFFTSKASPGWYTSEGILISLFDLLLDSCCDNRNSVILVQGANFSNKPPSLSEEFTEISQLYNNRDVIYIRLQPTDTPGGSCRHWIVFYFFENNGQKELLLIDSLNQQNSINMFSNALKPFLEQKKYHL